MACIFIGVFAVFATGCGASSVYSDGIYTGSGNLSLETDEASINYDVTAAITVEEGVITAIDIDPVETNEDVETIIADINKAYLNSDGTTSIAEIDCISGATLSYDAIMEALNSAVAQAAGQETVQEVELVDDGDANAENTQQEKAGRNAGVDYLDGTYEGTAYCESGYDVTASVIVKDGAIFSVSVTGDTESSSSSRRMKKAASQMTEAFEGKTADDSLAVDTVSGATYSSDAINKAVADALAQAQM